ncbi:MAG: CvpA family protein [Clostridia bacterium]|nr:CvpA family protein [Clostridia bacterium]
MNGSTTTGASSFGTVGVIVLSLIAVLALIGALKGRRRGFLRQTVRTITVVLAVVIAFFAIRIIQNIISSWFYAQTPESLISMIEGFGLNLGDLGTIAEGISTKTVEYIVAIPLYLVVLPILFVAIFLVASIITAIIYKILCRIFRLRKWNKKRFLSRLLGLLIGAAQGALVAVICLSPFIGLASTISGAVNDMPAGEAKTEVLKIYDKNLKPYTEDASVALLDSLGAGMIYDSLTTATVGGATHNMSTEIAGPALKLISAAVRLADINWQDLTEEDKTTLNILIEVADESPYTATILADLLSALAGAYRNGTAGIESNGLAKDLVVELLAVFEGINEKELVATLSVVRDVLFMLSDEGAISTLGDSTADLTRISDIFASKDDSGKTLIDRITEKLKESDRTASLVSTITKISITAMSQNMSGLGGVEVNEETYEKVKDGLSDVVNISKDDYATDEEYVGAISDSLNTTFVDNGIVLDKSVVDDMAQHVADNYGDKETLSDEEIDSIILSYYSAYLESQSSGTTPDIPGLPDINPQQ